MTSHAGKCPWDLIKFHTLPLNVDFGTWKNSEISPSIEAMNLENYNFFFWLQGICGKYDEICGKYEGICRNMKEYAENMGYLLPTPA